MWQVWIGAEVMKRWKCLIGKHEYEQHEEIVLDDGFIRVIWTTCVWCGHYDGPPQNLPGPSITPQG